MADQLAFEWPTGVALGAEDFFVSDANASAYAMVQTPEFWPEGKLALIGPKGCGKSHLARIFASQNGARIVKAAEGLADARPDRPTVVEDVSALPQDAEETLFHLHNNLRSAGLPLLLTDTAPPARWDIALPDLASRMQAATVMNIDDPDDALFAALIMKLFSDRQIMPPPDLLPYLSRRLERSYPAAARIVAELDAAALAQGRKISRALAAELLDNTG